MLREDVDLTRDDIQLLASRDAVAAFFARLGYDTNQRVMQRATAMNITNDTLAANITHIERIASQDGGFFEVYLFEVKSVTVTATQGIVRAFRDRPGDYLLVLTDDYDRLDFILVERYTPPLSPDTNQPMLGTGARNAVGVRPRVLTVLRRNPGQVALRVLRRFSYTEGDTFAQYEKLISAYAVAEWSKPYFNNRALFSDYYLTDRLPHDALWNDPTTSAAMTRAYRHLRDIVAGTLAPFAGQSEEAVRAALIEPALRLLGFTPQPATTPHADAVVPDYRLFAADQTSNKPLALCLAYPWNRNLDAKDDQRDSRRPDDNPGASVVTLLDSGEAAWAIVTNGKLWRLYAAGAHSRATNYYEIDLEETLALPAEHSADAFRYCWLLLRAEAFVPMERIIDGETRSLCFLDWLMNESERYARRLGERLKERVFEEIFPHFARGFILSARGSGRLPADLEDLPAAERNRLLEPFFNGTLTFLYRLLFLLYAESRDLLPVREERGYFPHSLETLKREIAQHAGTIEEQAPARIAAHYSEHSAALSDHLHALFRAIDQGNPSLNVPVYNGGLFVTTPAPTDDSPEAAVAAFLATHAIPDRQLALGLDRMARDVDEQRHDLAFIDYKSLGVRQLGSIYEGLLEFKLRVAPEMMAVVQGKKTEEIVPYSEAAQQKLKIAKEGRGKDAREKTYPRGHVYLENDRRERKATGSYYTPDYIVKYIVAHTVGPVLRDKLERLRPLLREAEQTLRHERDKAKALKRSDINPAHETYKKYRQSLNEAFFDLTVLDPAMGSGHFLVEAVDYITDRVADFLAGFKWNPIVYELALTRQRIQQDMERQGITIDAGKLTDLNLLKRQVLKRCIYGVDLNPMAVELAKVSLWLDCFTLGAPLSFLDHHMKCGNSLIGGRIDEARTAIEEGQLSFFGSSLWAGALLATESMIQVGRLSDVTEQQVRESKQHYRAAADALAPFKRILDIYVSRWFGNEPVKGKHGKANVDKAIDFLRSPEAEAWYQHPDRTEKLTDEQHAVVGTAMQAAQQHGFFHWELEFPEVFFAPNPGAAQEIKLKDNPGFDAVVGNPPYIRIQEMVGIDVSQLQFFSEVYEAAEQNYDIYALFAEQGYRLVKEQSNERGLVGLILPNKFFTVDYGKGLRHFLASRKAIRCIIDFDAGQVFAEATTYTCLLFLSGIPTQTFLYYRLPLGQPIELALQVMEREVVNISTSSLSGDRSWLFHPDNEQTIVEKLEKQGDRLDHVTERIFQGLKTGADKIYIVEVVCQSGTEIEIFSDHLEGKRTVEVGLWHPLIKGGNSDRYEIKPANLVVLFPYSKGTDHRIHLIPEIQIKTSYPRTYSYLLETKSYLEKRESGKMLGANWYAFTRNQALDVMPLPKLITPDFAESASFSYDASGKLFFPGGAAGGYGILVKQNWDRLYVLSLLNSRLLDWRVSKNTTTFRGGWRSYESRFISELPIRRITFTLTLEQRDYYREKARLLYATCLDKRDQQCVLGFVNHHLAQQPEQSDVVHDLLAYLAEEMIRLNKEKRAAIKQFLGWLETTLKLLPDREGRVGIDALTGKSKLLDYPGDYQKGEPPLSFDDLLDTLRKNRTRLGVSLSDAALIERLRQAYEASLAAVLPLKDRLAATDALIDAVVYRLYGLTEEEVKVVEGKQ